MSSGAPAASEVEIGREAILLLDKLLAVSVDRDMVIVRVYGADASAPDLHIGTSAERALRIGALFTKAAHRLDPRLAIAPGGPT